MLKLYPITPNEKIIITAHTLPSLLEGSVPPFDGEKTQEAVFYLERGILSAIRLLPEGHEDMEMPPEWHRISLPPHQFIVPAFVDCHLHLALDGVEGFRSFITPPSPQLLLTRLQTLATAGVLAVRDGGDQFGSAFTAQKLSMDAKPETGPLPQIVATGPALFRRGHYGVKLGGDGLAGLEKLEDEIRRRKDSGAEQLKVILSGLVSLTEPGKVGPLQFNLNELQSIVQIAKTLALPVMVHASSDAAVRLAIQAGVHSVEHGYFITEETLREMGDTGVAWVPTLAPLAALTNLAAGPEAVDSEPQAAPGNSTLTENSNFPAPHNTTESVLRPIVEEHLRMIMRAHQLGVTVGVGTDGGAPGVSWNDGYWLELKLLARAGFTPQELLSLATINGAALLGLEQERGRIAMRKHPCWLCLDTNFLAGRIERNTLKGIIFLSPEPK